MEKVWKARRKKKRKKIERISRQELEKKAITWKENARKSNGQKNTKKLEEK